MLHKLLWRDLPWPRAGREPVSTHLVSGYHRQGGCCGSPGSAIRAGASAHVAHWSCASLRLGTCRAPETVKWCSPSTSVHTYTCTYICACGCPYTYVCACTWIYTFIYTNTTPALWLPTPTLTCPHQSQQLPLHTALHTLTGAVHSAKKALNRREGGWLGGPSWPGREKLTSSETRQRGEDWVEPCGRRGPELVRALP